MRGAYSARFRMSWSRGSTGLTPSEGSSLLRGPPRFGDPRRRGDARGVAPPEGAPLRQRGERPSGRRHRIAGLRPGEDLRQVLLTPGLPGARHLPPLELDTELVDPALERLTLDSDLLGDVRRRREVESLLQHHVRPREREAAHVDVRLQVLRPRERIDRDRGLEPRLVARVDHDELRTDRNAAL